MLLFTLFLGLQAVSPPVDIETIEITGVRTPTNIEDLASPVSVLTAADLERRQFTRVVDALSSLPGVAVSRGSSVGGTTQLRLRGGEANHVLVIIDGVEVNDPAAGDEFQFEHLSVTEIERIELIRGPLSTAWGTDALAGVINIVTKSGEGAEPRGYVSAELGSFKTYQLNAGFQTSGAGWHLAAGTSWRDSGGVNAARTGEEDDGYENFSANIRGGIKATDRFGIDFNLRVEDSETEFDGVDFSTGLLADSDHVSRTTKYIGSVSANIAAVPDLWQQKFRVTYLDTELNNRVADTPDGSTFAQKWGFYSDAVITPYKDQRVTLFVDHEASDFTQRGTATVFGNPNQSQEFSVTGYGIDYVGELLGGLSANLGLRYDDNSDFGNFTSWRTGLSARIPPTGTRLFASVSRGQKAPNFIERFGFFPDQFLGNADLQPEESIQTEFGIEQRIGGALTLGVTAFFTDLEDEINGFAFDATTRLFTAENAAGESSRDGLEVTFELKPNERLKIEGQYSFIRAREEDGFGGVADELRRPRHQAFVGADWRASDALSFSVDAEYTGKRDDLFFPPFPQPSEIVRLDDYLLLRFAASYALKDNLKLRVRAENLLDETYEDVVGFNTPGFGAFVGLSVQF